MLIFELLHHCQLIIWPHHPSLRCVIQFLIHSFPLFVHVEDTLVYKVQTLDCPFNDPWMHWGMYTNNS
jgi:hypothetical protein